MKFVFLCLVAVLLTLGSSTAESAATAPETRNLHDAMPDKVRELSELLTQIRNQEQGR